MSGVVQAVRPKPCTYFSAICCRNISPVDNARISYFFTRRADNVPLPAPGFPNINMRKTFPFSSTEFLYVFRKKGRALLDGEELAIDRREYLIC